MFDFERFMADFHAYRRRQHHTLTAVAILIERTFDTLKRSTTPPFDRIWFTTMLLLADYADLDLDSYRLEDHGRASDRLRSA